MYCHCNDHPSMYQATARIARRRYGCDECGWGILPGERYDREFGVRGRGGRVFKTCARCLALREWIRFHVPGFVWPRGDLREAALAAAAARAREAPGLLFGALRREILIRRHRG